MCLFALSWIEINHKIKHCQVEHSSILIRKLYKEKILKGK